MKKFFCFFVAIVAAIITGAISRVSAQELKGNFESYCVEGYRSRSIEDRLQEVYDLNEDGYVGIVDLIIAKNTEDNMSDEVQKIMNVLCGKEVAVEYFEESIDSWSAEYSMDYVLERTDARITSVTQDEDYPEFVSIRTYKNGVIYDLELSSIDNPDYKIRNYDFHNRRISLGVKDDRFCWDTNSFDIVPGSTGASMIDIDLDEADASTKTDFYLIASNPVDYTVSMIQSNRSEHFYQYGLRVILKNGFNRYEYRLDASRDITEYCIYSKDLSKYNLMAVFIKDDETVEIFEKGGNLFYAVSVG